MKTYLHEKKGSKMAQIEPKYKSEVTKYNPFKLYEKDKDSLEEDMSPFGFITDGLEADTYVEKDKGLVWSGGNQYDEYGMPHSPWAWEERTYGGNPSWW